ncbi:unnamed protein product [Cuscuta campestris]|uniref:Retrotransposon gag domain-containing protein n=1 Tax=Cuscuta campestris TaxID=132261 RepID=A0A484KVZ9_9ASTE|nr:unnamed protein product [Cuscuta campestris]
MAEASSATIELEGKVGELGHAMIQMQRDIEFRFARLDTALAAIQTNLAALQVGGGGRLGHQEPGRNGGGATPKPKLEPPTELNPYGGCTSKESTASIPVRLLTRAEKMEKDAKGLCYNCDKKWSRDHKCGRFVLMMGEDEGNEEELELEEEDEVTADISSLQSMAGMSTPRSLRLTGQVAGQAVGVLIDGGSTHNFIHPQTVERLGLAVEAVPPFQVYIGNGDSPPCERQCRVVNVGLQGTNFAVDLYVLRIHGHDVVLRVRWLRELGCVLHDYDKVTMEFTWRDQAVTLRGDAPVARPLTVHQLRAMAGNQEMSFCMELMTLQLQESPAVSTKGPGGHLTADMEQLLADFKEIFEEPT